MTDANVKYGKVVDNVILAEDPLNNIISFPILKMNCVKLDSNHQKSMLKKPLQKYWLKERNLNWVLNLVHLKKFHQVKLAVVMVYVKENWGDDIWW